nr:protein TRACHEARY ELEMENT DIFFERENTIATION-RELATED 7A-like [Procambarus clarkii]
MFTLFLLALCDNRFNALKFFTQFSPLSEGYRQFFPSLSLPVPQAGVTQDTTTLTVEAPGIVSLVNPLSTLAAPEYSHSQPPPPSTGIFPFPATSAQFGEYSHSQPPPPSTGIFPFPATSAQFGEYSHSQPPPPSSGNIPIPSHLCPVRGIFPFPATSAQHGNIPIPSHLCPVRGIFPFPAIPAQLGTGGTCPTC